VTIFAGIKDPTALHLNGDDIYREMVMSAAGLGIDIDSADVYGEFVLRFR